MYFENVRNERGKEIRYMSGEDIHLLLQRQKGVCYERSFSL